MENQLALMRTLLEQTRLDAERARVDRKFTIDFILSVQDLLIDFAKTSDWQKFRLAIKRLKEREGVRLTIDNWFWRPESDLSLDQQLLRRAKYLCAQHYSVDQTWDLLTEFISGWAHTDIDESMLRSVILEAANASAA